VSFISDVRGSKKSGTTERFRDNRAKSPSQNATYGDTNIFDSLEEPGAHDVDPYMKKKRIPDTATQALRLQRETDFLK
jgi:hypothetical protein